MVVWPIPAGLLHSAECDPMSAFLDRFKEPSSWAGISALLAVFGMPMGLAEVAVQVGVALTAAAAVLIKERARPKVQ